mgnify:CR=1 FL=1
MASEDETEDSAEDEAAVVRVHGVRQSGPALERLVDLLRARTPLGDGPDHQGGAAPGVAAREHARLVGLVPVLPGHEPACHVHAELLEAGRRLETHAADVQDIEFTVERGKLWMLQTRTGKRTGAAAVNATVYGWRGALLTASTGPVSMTWPR